MRLIYAEEVLNNIDELEKSPWFRSYLNKAEFLIRKEAIEVVRDLCVRTAKTVDPVNHGHWNKSGFGWRCSECGARDDEAFFFRKECGIILYSEYCRVCGAKMSEEVSG